MTTEPHDYSTVLLALLLLAAAYGASWVAEYVWPPSPPDCGYITQKMAKGFKMAPGDWRDFAECQSNVEWAAVE